MRFALESLPFGRILRVEPGGTLLVRLDDGSELSGVLKDERLSNALVPGERVCVSIVSGKPPTLTGYLTSSPQPPEKDAMDEQTWLTSSDPEAMLTFLLNNGKLSERKARLFACAAARRIWHLLTDERSRWAVEGAERCVDGFVSAEGLNMTYALAFEVANALDYPDAADAAACTASDDIYSYVYPATVCAARAVANTVGAEDSERAAQASLLRDMIGPLAFRPLPPLPPSVRTWNDGLIVKLATAIYEERTMPEGTLDSLRLGILADLMEEAGVTDKEILGHLRQQGAVHVRGCHILDVLLEKM